MAEHASHSDLVARKKSCDCLSKNLKCSGGCPCAKPDCTCTALRKTGGACEIEDALATSVVHERTDGRGSTSSGRSGQVSYRARFPDGSVSCGTEISGLIPSRFLSAFLRHFLPMCCVADDRSIREGLMHAMSTLQNRRSLAEQLLEEDDDKHGQALQCSLFSGFAIGGLLLGYPAADVSRYLESARLCRERVRSLEDQSAVSALILYANAHAFVGTRESREEYREGMNEAAAISQVLLDEDPFVASFTEYRRHMDNAHLLTKRVVSSDNPIKPLGRLMGTSRMGVKTEEGRRVRAWIDKGRVMMSNRGGERQGAHPAHVVEDCLFLTIRYLNAVGGENSGLGRVHAFLGAELQRLVKVEAGGVVLATLAGALLGVKSRLARADDLLPVAELVLSLFNECPGLARYDTRSAAHRALAVFKLFANRQLYDALRNVVVAGSEEYTPTFDEYHPGLPICGVEFVAHQAEDILRLASPSGHSPGAG